MIFFCFLNNCYFFMYVLIFCGWNCVCDACFLSIIHLSLLIYFLFIFYYVSFQFIFLFTFFVVFLYTQYLLYVKGVFLSLFRCFIDNAEQNHGKPPQISQNHTICFYSMFSFLYKSSYKNYTYRRTG